LKAIDPSGPPGAAELEAARVGSNPSDTVERTPPSRIALGSAVAVMCLVWGSTWYVVRAGLTDVPPLGGAGARFLIAWLAMLVIAPRFARREGGVPPTLDLVVSMGVLNFALTYGLVYWGEVYLPSALAAVLWAIYPLIMALVGHVYVPGERLHVRQLGGVLAGLAGVVCLFATDLAALEGQAQGTAPPAALGVRGVGALFLLAPVVSALGTAHVKRHGGGTSSALLNRDGMLLGAVLLLATSALLERDPAAWDFTGRGVACLLYLSLFGTVLAFTLYFWALRHARATQLALMSFVTPAIAVTIGVLVGDEPVTAWTGVGLVAILGGVSLSMGLGRRRPRGALD
jgi:drug/metabolite transporter (DMT)-like permease